MVVPAATTTFRLTPQTSIVALPAKRDFYDKATFVRVDLRFSFMAFCFYFDCGACCSPPCSYGHFL